MKMMRYWQLLSVGLLFSSCMTIQPVTVERVEKVTLTGLPLNPAINFHAVVHNPNSFGLSLHRLSADFAVEGQMVARVSMSERRHLAARSSLSIPLSVRPDLKNTAGLLLSGNTLSNWHSGGIIEIRKWMFRKTFPFSVSGRF